MKNLIFLLIIFFIVACSQTDTTLKIGDEKILKDTKCFQLVIDDQTLFSKDFKVDFDMPEIEIYAEQEYNNLSDESQYEALQSIGQSWFKCHPDHEFLSVWLLDQNGFIITVSVVIKETDDF